MFRVVLRVKTTQNNRSSPHIGPIKKKFSPKSYYLCITNNEIVQNSKSKAKTFLFLCNFNVIVLDFYVCGNHRKRIYILISVKFRGTDPTMFVYTGCISHPCLLWCGSVTYWYGSGSGSEDPYNWVTDPDPDPALLISGCQDVNNKICLKEVFLLFKFLRYIYISL